ncbi:hypothetical protein HAP41_0000009785 [Bradyrhizobium barranii subsp. apii]|uniref:peptidylprolyl isomerase n=1 Tax=Bradyrhizobium barranii subsp. apii TaxID=2819348 RepID=A0A8T5VJJ4_9BRAD|nr:peptidylprolyl isomerase [Bradyrhizobium barranii]UPT89230.1 hypothetical protein HAP41_0000009785 [Bradyrhizobium barranii subsp. apii]
MVRLGVEFSIGGFTFKRFTVNSPLDYLHRIEAPILGLAQAIDGKSAGFSFQQKIAPKFAFGEVDPALDLCMSIGQFPTGVRSSLKVGFQFESEIPNSGKLRQFSVVRIAGSTVLATGNHPLAGKVVDIAGAILSVRHADELELQHQHAHGPFTRVHGIIPSQAPTKLQQHPCETGSE